MRKICALFLSLTIILSAGIMPFAAKQASAAESKAEQVITALGIMNTDKGSSAGTSRVTRAGFAQMLINLSSLKGKVTGKCNISLFSDVSKKFWAAGYIQSAVTQGWMTGYMNGKFKPNQGIKLQEAVNAVLKLLGYTDNDFSGDLVESEMALYVSKNLDKNISRARTSYLSYNDCIKLFYNTLNATMKDGTVYAKYLGYTLDSNNNIDYLSLISNKTTGPIIADNNWKNDIPFSIVSATCYKNGEKCSYTEIEDYDVLYYSKSLKSIWIYDERVTGTVESIDPDQMAPTSVTVAGKQYTLGTSAMSIEFSSLGKVTEGDVVTLLLGKNDTVVGVLPVENVNTTITGIVLKTGEHVAKVDDGYTTTGYVDFVDASGSSYEQDYDDGSLLLNEGDLVRVTYTDGKAAVSKYELGSKNSLGNCVFNSAGTIMGDVKLSSNIKILDTYDGQYIKVFPERLAGTDVSSYILYYELNSKGELTQLILNNFTGDISKYGIYTGYNTQSGKIAYNYIIDGVNGSTNIDSIAYFSTEAGPKGFKYSDGTLSSTFNLNAGTVKSITSTTALVDNTKYSLADGYDIYYLNNGEYTKTTLSMVSNLSKYNLYAYYDDTVSNGGRVRIILAESK